MSASSGAPPEIYVPHQPYVAFEIPMPWNQDETHHSGEWIIMPAREEIMAELEADKTSDTRWHEPGTLIAMVTFVGQCGGISGKRPTITFLP